MATGGHNGTDCRTKPGAFVDDANQSVFIRVTSHLDRYGGLRSGLMRGMNKSDQLNFVGFEAPVNEKPKKTIRPKKSQLLAPALDSPVIEPDTVLVNEPASEPLNPSVKASVNEPLQALPAPIFSEAELESMAQSLTQNANYRVLRRLSPKLDYGPVLENKTQRVIVLDTETTGLDSKTEKIIELAMLSVLVDTATGLPVGPVTLYESFEDPGKAIPPQITDITGIDDSMVQGHQIDDLAVTALVEQADLIVAHNAGFDRPFVEARLPVFAAKPWACSFLGVDWKKEGSGSAKLEFLATERGWFYDAHRAQVDCHALLQVLTAPLANGQTGLSRLLSGSGQTRYKLRATSAPFEAKDKLKSRGYRWDGEGRVWWCNLVSDESLDAECAWLRAEIYGARTARVQIEALSSRVQFSSRPGVLSERSV